jgi:alpha-tubulin suppressor-like RCC1 family protein
VTCFGNPGISNDVLTAFTKIYLGDHCCLFVGNTGQLYCTGYSDMLGIPESQGRGVNESSAASVESVPYPLLTTLKVSNVAIRPNVSHALFVTNQGALFAVGSSEHGENGATSSCRYIRQVTGRCDVNMCVHNDTIHFCSVRFQHPCYPEDHHFRAHG